MDEHRDCGCSGRMSIAEGHWLCAFTALCIAACALQHCRRRSAPEGGQLPPHSTSVSCTSPACVHRQRLRLVNWRRSRSPLRSPGPSDSFSLPNNCGAGRPLPIHITGSSTSALTSQRRNFCSCPRRSCSVLSMDWPAGDSVTDDVASGTR
ncbi:hypothetical protein C8R46DRAFT_1151795 [Mycena filopes]|nr:hypothetical protein C8R46DRAFT_1151795 [Mycena filopes]